MDNNLTILAYAWGEKLDRVGLNKAIAETHKYVGRCHTVIVSDRLDHGLEGVDETQLEPSLKDGDINSMSIDMNSRLYTRFKTPYVLIIQNDGYPLRSGIEEFIGKHDFIGAPYVRNIWWKRWISDLFKFRPMNGGFSLRSKRCCELVAKYWNEKYHNLAGSHWGSEDMFVTHFLPRHEAAFRREMRFPSIREALRFSYEEVGAPYSIEGRPFGFHRLDSLSALSNSTPDVSILLLTWNRAPMLKICLEKLFAALSPKLRHEVILMDNASTDDTKSVLNQYVNREGVRLIFNEQNLRLNAYKKLFALARGRIMIEVDDDVIEFPDNFDKLFVDYFKTFSDYGYLALDVIQNEKTNGAKGDAVYKNDIRGDMEVLEGPVGGWCAAFRRRHYRLFKFIYDRLQYSMARSEDGTLSGFLNVVLRKRQGLIGTAKCLHACGVNYAQMFGLTVREREKYLAGGLPNIAEQYK